MIGLYRDVVDTVMNISVSVTTTFMTWCCGKNLSQSQMIENVSLFLLLEVGEIEE
jgi:hypothetical protein